MLPWQPVSRATREMKTSQQTNVQIFCASSLEVFWQPLPVGWGDQKSPQGHAII